MGVSQMRPPCQLVSELDADHQVVRFERLQRSVDRRGIDRGIASQQVRANFLDCLMGVALPQNLQNADASRGSVQSVFPQLLFKRFDLSADVHQLSSSVAVRLRGNGALDILRVMRELVR